MTLLVAEGAMKILFRILWGQGWLLLCVSVAAAQPFILVPISVGASQMAATDDGRQIYFASGLVLKGKPTLAPPLGTDLRLYRTGSDGVTLFAERGALAFPQFGSSGSGAANPQVSGDGSVVGFTLNDVCASETDCAYDLTKGIIRGSPSADGGAGALQLTRNGKWALLSPAGISGSSIPTVIPTLIELSNGQRFEVPPAPPRTLRGVSADGSVLAGPGPGLVGLGIWKQGQVTPFQLPGGFYGWFALSEDGSTLFCNRATPAGSAVGWQFVALNLGAGTVTVLYQSPDLLTIPLFVAASNDARTVLYRVFGPDGTGPFFVADLVAGTNRQISLADGEGVSDGALTGSGDIAFLATTFARLVQLTFATGAVETIIPATPMCVPPQSVAIGSLVRLHCSVTGTADDLRDKILLDGQPVPLVLAEPGIAGVQVPWETTVRNHTLLLDVPSPSPFQSNQTTLALTVYAAFEKADPGQPALFGIKILKGDWSGMVTSPPGPGEVVNLYMTGLGPVKGAVQTGVPASTTQPNPIANEISCQLLPGKTQLRTLFAGLAPGMIGIYQVTLQVPTDADTGAVTGLSCALGNGLFTVGTAFAGRP